MSSYKVNAIRNPYWRAAQMAVAIHTATVSTQEAACTETVTSARDVGSSTRGTSRLLVYWGHSELCGSRIVVCSMSSSLSKEETGSESHIYSTYTQTLVGLAGFPPSVTVSTCKLYSSRRMPLIPPIRLQSQHHAHENPDIQSSAMSFRSCILRFYILIISYFLIACVQRPTYR